MIKLMKYCSNCGAELNEGADVCISCGKLLKTNNDSNVNKAGKTLGIISLFVWVVPLAG